MANPTTNYGFVLPTSTDLVTDLPADFDVALQGVDTRLKALQPNTTLGDLAYGSATANTNTRLPIGTTGQVLAVNSGVPAWTTVASGGMTLLSTTTLSGATTTISSISQGYTDLVAYIYGVTNATSNGILKIKPNNLSNSYYNCINDVSSSSIGRNTDIFLTANAGLTSATENAYTIKFPNYASTSSFKTFESYGGFYNVSLSAFTPTMSFGYVFATTAISSLVFLNSGGNLTAGTVLLYGVK
jgi:hypothetical protein